MSETVQCIGPMIHGWYAELRFDDGEATVRAHEQNGEPTVATVPLGTYTGPEHDEVLDPDHSQNKNLMAVVAAPRLIGALRFCERKLAPRDDREPSVPVTDDERYVDERDDSEMLREVHEALECLDVPTE